MTTVPPTGSGSGGLPTTVNADDQVNGLHVIPLGTDSVALDLKPPDGSVGPVEEIQHGDGTSGESGQYPSVYGPGGPHV